MTGYILGVDGGNTKTIAVLAQPDGTALGSGRSGCGDIYGAGSPEAALAAIDAAVEAALAPAGIRPRDVAAACFSLAGADWPEDFALLRAALEQRGFTRVLTVVNDALGALRAGTPDGIGVAVVCGTGAATGARGPDGTVWHSSWWQDVQGAQELGRKVLWAVYHAELGLAPPTRLTARVLEFFGLPTVEAVLHRRTARVRAPGPDVALLTRALLDEAAAGDEVARRIVREHGAALGDYALVAARRVGLAASPFTLALSGGVLRHPSHWLSQALAERVQAANPGVQVVLSRLEPVGGAVLLALEAGGERAGEAVIARLAATLPAGALFETSTPRECAGE